MQIALENENYLESHDLKEQFDEIWYSVPHEFRHLPKYLDEEERNRYIDCFGRKPDDDGVRRPQGNRPGHLNSHPLPGKRHFHGADGSDGCTDANCYIHDSHHHDEASQMQRLKKEKESAMHLARGVGLAVIDSDSDNDFDRQLEQRSINPTIAPEFRNGSSISPLDETQLDPNAANPQPTNHPDFYPEEYDLPAEREPIINRYDRLDVSADRRRNTPLTGNSYRNMPPPDPKPTPEAAPSSIAPGADKGKGDKCRVQ